MIQLEPENTPYDFHFRVLGIPVRVHPLFWVAAFFLGFQNGSPIALIVWIVAMFVSVLVHELGHALTMRRYGHTPRVVLYHFGGLAIPGERSRYSDFNSSRNTSENVLITLAGPGAGFLLAALVIGVLVAAGGAFYFITPTVDHPIFWLFQLPAKFPMFEPVVVDGVPVERMSPLARLVSDLLFINIFWGLMNLLPIFPLDGGQVLRELLSMEQPLQGLSLTLQISCAVAVGAAVFGFVIMQSSYMGFMFAILGFSNYQLWQQIRSRYG